MTADTALTDCRGAAEDRPGQFDLLGRTWTLLPGVCAPVHTTCTELFSAWLPFPVGGAFLAAVRVADRSDRSHDWQWLPRGQSDRHPN